jgi:hypothetical protein
MIELLPVMVGLVAAALALAVSVSRAISKTRAEGRLLSHLKVASQRGALKRLLEDLAEEQADLDLVYSRLERQLTKSLSRMNESDQRRIREGLEQPSVQGRRRYLDKLVDEATEGEFNMPRRT